MHLPEMEALRMSYHSSIVPSQISSSCFLRGASIDILEDFLSDPWPKKRHFKRRRPPSQRFLSLW